MDHRSTPEWQALNAIWKNMDATQRVKNRENFETLCTYLKHQFANTASIHKKNPYEDYGYLSPLSAGAVDLVVSLVENGEKNLYHSIMATLSSWQERERLYDVETLWTYYRKRYRIKRPYIETHEPEVREVMALCLQRYNEKMNKESNHAVSSDKS